jgi:hypothetical protein
MVDFKKIPLMPALLACACAVLAAQGIYVFAASAEQKSADDTYIKFIPSDQALESRMWSSGGGITLKPIDCNKDLANRNAQCETCNAMRYSCPDCCLVRDENNIGLACDGKFNHPANNPRYFCGKAPFDPEDLAISKKNRYYTVNLTKDIICDDTYLPYAQAEGCKHGIYSSRPKAEDCEWSGTGHWFCLGEPTQEPEQPFRLPLVENSILWKELNKLIKEEKVYNIEKYEHKGRLSSSPCPDKKDECWEYRATDDFWSFCGNCTVIAGDWEKCIKRTQCCQYGNSKSTYSTPSGNFYKCPCMSATGQTVDKQCASCNKRISFETECKVGKETLPGCKPGQCTKPYNKTNCQKWIKDYRDFLLGEYEAGSFLDTCFKPIESKFYYKFVPKSSEKFLLQWQIFCQSLTKEDRTDRGFYTMIKVYKEDEFLEWRDIYKLQPLLEPAPKHISLVHQKTFSGDFTITSSTFLDAGAKNELGEHIFETGTSYAAVICYSIPNVSDEDLRMKVTSMNFIVFRHRD